MCTAGGKWGGYDKNGCGKLANNFTNLVMGSENVFNYSFVHCCYLNYSIFLFYATNKQYIGKDGMLSKLVEESLNNRMEQSTGNMNDISNTLINIANYVNTSKAMLNETVS